MKLNLKCMIIFSLMLAVAGTALAGNEFVKSKRSVPYKTIFNHDGSHPVTCESSYRIKGQPVDIEKVMSASFDELAGIDIDAVFFCPGLCWVPWWQSDVYSYDEHAEWYKERFGEDYKPGVFMKYVRDGGDFIQLFVEHARKNNYSAIISFRLKDEHALLKPPCKIYDKNMDLRLNHHPNARFGERGFSWKYPLVRQYVFDLLTEIATKYDIDGLELDFIRFPPYFDLDVTAEPERYAIMTDFVTRVREMLTKSERDGKKRYLAIRVPNTIKDYQRIGLDLGHLDRNELVDIITVSPSFVSQIDTDFNLLRKWAPSAAMFLEMDFASSRGPGLGWGFARDPRGAGPETYWLRYVDAIKHYTAANLALAQGADGMYTFNFTYYRFLKQEPPWGVFKKFKEKEWLSKQDQLYWMPAWWQTGWHGRQFHLPKTFVVDDREEFVWQMALPAQGVKSSRLRLQFAKENVAFGLVWDVRINGKVCKVTKDVSEPFENPYVQPGQFAVEYWQYYAFDVPTDALKNGRNVVSVRLENGPVNKEFDTTLIWMDLAVYAK